MQYSHPANHNEMNEAVKRFELMESSHQRFFFDVHAIEDIYDFYAGKLQFDRADKALELGIGLHPHATSLKVRKANIYIEKDADEKALNLLEELLLLEPSNTEIYLNLIWLYLRMKQCAKAIELVHDALKNLTNSPQEFFTDVVFYFNRFKYYQEVITLVETMPPEISENEDVLLEFIYSCEKTNNNSKAADVYRRILNVDPFNANIWYNNGLLLIDLEREDEALPCFDYALALKPDLSDAFFGKGNCLAQNKQYRKALNNYLEFISFQPEFALGYYYIADCWFNLNNDKAAIAFYKLALKKDPLLFKAWEDYAILLLNKDDTKGCRRVLKEAFKIDDLFYDDPKSALLSLYAQSYILDENWRMARMYLKKTILDFPYSYQALNDLFKLQKALKPSYTWKSFFQQYHRDFFFLPVFKYLQATLNFFEFESIEGGFLCLKEGIEINPMSLEQFVRIHPEIENFRKYYPPLDSLLKKHLK